MKNVSLPKLQQNVFGTHLAHIPLQIHTKIYIKTNKNIHTKHYGTFTLTKQGEHFSTYLCISQDFIMCTTRTIIPALQNLRL